MIEFNYWLVIQKMNVVLGNEHWMRYKSKKTRMARWCSKIGSASRWNEPTQDFNQRGFFLHCFHLQWILCDAQHMYVLHIVGGEWRVCVCRFICSGVRTECSLLVHMLSEDSAPVYCTVLCACVYDVHNHQQKMPNSPWYAIFIALTCPFRTLYHSRYSPQN